MSETARPLLDASGLPEHEAMRLFEVATGGTSADALLDRPVDTAGADRFRVLADRRRRGEPLQYLEGEVPFGPVVISVDPRVLIPRPETEELFVLATSMVDAPTEILDVCTGSGNLALALASTYPSARIHATDVSADALDVARANGERNGLDVTWLEGDLFAPVPTELLGRVDLIVANPPYLSEAELGALPVDVLHEPIGALVSGPLGDELVARIAAEAGTWLAPGGVIVCEISEFHTSDVVAMFGHLDADVRTDLFGKDRFVVGRRRVR
jgi:release factor glutamine methyltransferase